MTVLTVVAAMALGSTIGPVNQFGMMGIAQTLGLIVVYGWGTSSSSGGSTASRVAVQLPAARVIPLATTAALIWVGWKNVSGLHIFSLPTALDYAPWIAIGWLILGLADPAVGQPHRQGGVAAQSRRIDHRAARDAPPKLAHRPAL